ncbi:MAG: FmdB family transcriptional regulator [Planctomycetota bacterium]|nr:MAG: FmdB family transcriptional regulator [Planctomycetota bacterium]
MPVYVYEVIKENGEPGERFEVRQRITDPPLTKHPETGEPVRRVIQPVFVGGKYFETPSKKRQLLSDKNLESHGFTKYVKTDSGRYRKLFGKGPDLKNPG